MLVKCRHKLRMTNLAEAQFGCNFIHSRCFGVIYQFQAVLSGVLKHESHHHIKMNDHEINKSVLLVD